MERYFIRYKIEGRESEYSSIIELNAKDHCILDINFVKSKVYESNPLKFKNFESNLQSVYSRIDILIMNKL